MPVCPQCNCDNNECFDLVKNDDYECLSCGHVFSIDPTDVPNETALAIVSQTPMEIVIDYPLPDGRMVKVTVSTDPEVGIVFNTEGRTESNGVPCVIVDMLDMASGDDEHPRVHIYTPTTNTGGDSL